MNVAMAAARLVAQAAAASRAQQAEFRAFTREWNHSLEMLERSLQSTVTSHGGARHCVDRAARCEHLLRESGAGNGTSVSCSRALRRRCARACGVCKRSRRRHEHAEAPWSPSACSLVATRHIAKTGGVSVRDWMLQLEKAGQARFFGPVTWMRHRGRCDGNKLFLHCCHPSDPRPVSECQQVPVTEARSIVVRQLAGDGGSGLDGGGGGGDGGVGGGKWRAAVAAASPSLTHALTLLEFHWPDSALGEWGPFTDCL